MCMVRKPSLEPIVLARRWDITPGKTQQTMQATMQRGIWSMLHLSLSRQFRANDRNLHYHHLTHLVFSGMMFVSTVSRKGIRYAQVYTTDFGWTRAFPMSLRSEAHEALSLLHVRDDLLSVCICDNAKEMIQGTFYQKLNDAECHLKQLEQYFLVKCCRK